MKTLVALLVLLLAASAPVVWGQAYPSAAIPLIEPPPLPLAEAQAALGEEEARLERLWLEKTRLQNVLADTRALVEKAEAAKADAQKNSEVSFQEFKNFSLAVAKARSASTVVLERLETFRREIAGAEKGISRLKRNIVIGELDAEAARLEETAAGK